MPQELDLRQPKLTLRELGVEPMFPKCLKSGPQVPLVVSLGSRIDEYVVYEDYDELVQVVVEDPVHQVHESCWCVRQAERHDDKLIKSTSGTKSSLRDVLLPNEQLVIA